MFFSQIINILLDSKHYDKLPQDLAYLLKNDDLAYARIGFQKLEKPDTKINFKDYHE